MLAKPSKIASQILLKQTFVTKNDKIYIPFKGLAYEYLQIKLCVYFLNL